MDVFFNTFVYRNAINPGDQMLPGLFIKNSKLIYGLKKKLKNRFLKFVSTKLKRLCKSFCYMQLNFY